jgi:hypothetical protein
MEINRRLALLGSIIGHWGRRFKIPVGQIPVGQIPVGQIPVGQIPVGQFQKITYTSEKNGFTVVSVKAPGMRYLVCVVGDLLAPMPGEIIRMQGEWAN